MSSQQYIIMMNSCSACIYAYCHILEGGWVGGGGQIQEIVNKLFHRIGLILPIHSRTNYMYIQLYETVGHTHVHHSKDFHRVGLILAIHS